MTSFSTKVRKTFQPVWTGMKVVGKGIRRGAEVTIKGVTHITSDISPLVKVVRLIGYIFLGVRFGTGRSPLPGLQTAAEDAHDMIDSVQWIGEAGEAIGARFSCSEIHPPIEPGGKPVVKRKRMSVLSIIGSTSLAFAGATGAVIWLKEMKILNLSKISAAMGKTPVLRLLTKITMLTVCRLFVIVGFGALAIDSIVKLCQENRAKHIINLSFELARSVTEVALNILLVSGVATVPAILALGIFAVLMGLTSFLYQKGYQKELQMAKT